jgi:hypothetical protein
VAIPSANAKSASPSPKQPARRWPLRGRKQLVAFERNLSPSQKHEDFEKWKTDWEEGSWNTDLR